MRETGLEERKKRPYHALSFLFVENLSPYKTSLYIPSRSDTYHLNLISRWLGHLLEHNPRIRLLRYAVSMFPPFVKPRLKGERNYTKRLVNQITYISQSPDRSRHTQSLTAPRRFRPSVSPAGSVSSRILLSSALRISASLT